MKRENGWVFKKKLISPWVKLNPRTRKKHKFLLDFRSELVLCDEFTHHSDGRKKDEMRNKKGSKFGKAVHSLANFFEFRILHSKVLTLETRFSHSCGSDFLIMRIIFTHWGELISNASKYLYKSNKRLKS